MRGAMRAGRGDNVLLPPLRGLEEDRAASRLGVVGSWLRAGSWRSRGGASRDRAGDSDGMVGAVAAALATTSGGAAGWNPMEMVVPSSDAAPADDAAEPRRDTTGLWGGARNMLF